MTDEDIDEALKEKWNELLNSCNGELISQHINRFDLKISYKVEQNLLHILRYQGKFWANMNKHSYI